MAIKYGTILLPCIQIGWWNIYPLVLYFGALMVAKRCLRNSSSSAEVVVVAIHLNIKTIPNDVAIFCYIRYRFFCKEILVEIVD